MAPAPEIGKTPASVRPLPSLPIGAGAAQDTGTGATAPVRDGLSLGAAGRGVVVEVISQFLWIKDKQVFKIAPSADGSVVFSHLDGKGALKSEKVLGRTDGPIRAVIHIKAGFLPFLNRELRVEVEHAAGESRVKVSDPKTGRVLQEAASR